MGEFGVQAKHANDQQNEEYVGLNDSGEEFLPPGKFKLDEFVVLQRKFQRRSVEASDFPPAQSTQQLIPVARDEVDEVPFEGLFRRKRARLGDRGFRELGVAATLFREAAQKSSGIVVQFAAQ